MNMNAKNTISILIIIAAVFCFTAGCITDTDVYQHITYNPSSADFVEKEHHFIYQDKQFTIHLTLDQNLFKAAENPASHETSPAFDSSEKEWLTKIYQTYANEPTQQPIIHDLAQQFQEIQTRYQFDSDEYVELVTAYIQSIPYYTDDSDAQYPIQMLYKYRGDCDDKSILLAAILAESGYNVSLLMDYPDNSHMTAAIAVETEYSLPEAPGYATIETTGYTFVTEKSNVLPYVGIVIPIGLGTQMYHAAGDVSFIMEKWELAEKRVDSGVYTDEDIYVYNLLTELESHPNREDIYQEMRAYD